MIMMMTMVKVYTHLKRKKTIENEEDTLEGGSNKQTINVV